ncbi:sec-independent protein translocase protein TatA [Acinetobacter marinus]|uniref:Sec-independent protein translocase protein TatA n=1 Tax=Acinetobacter marinus TaxID=281375 RepID=A0A1G6HJL2_9GAMM|nr:Sec-independent protein translocase subunit TatA [Acinetobacter marinus]SDB94343.1 sec-independent protein translocase protein TatA [Acinetobacter marinus]
MAGLSIWHIALLLIVVVLLFGTSKLKNLGRDLGGAVKDFKNSVKDEDAKLDQQKHQHAIDSEARVVKDHSNAS